MSKARQSNFELLRIVAMLCIVVHHLAVFGVGGIGYGDQLELSGRGLCGALVNSFVICGVNWFVLISGWFGVKRGLQASLRLVTECVVFGAIAWVGIALLANGGDRGLLPSLWFGKYWFVVSYIMMALCAPFLEVALAHVGNRHLMSCVACFTAVNVLFGWIGGRVTPFGYDFVNFMYLYVLGRLLRRFKEAGFPEWRGVWLVAFAFCGLALFCGWVLINRLGFAMNAVWWFAYNSPLVLMMSVSGMMLFANVNFSSRLVNFLAGGVFGVYVLHCATCVKAFRNELTMTAYEAFSWFGVLLLALGIVLVGTLVGALVESFAIKPIFSIGISLSKSRLSILSSKAYMLMVGLVANRRRRS